MMCPLGSEGASKKEKGTTKKKELKSQSSYVGCALRSIGLRPISLIEVPRSALRASLDVKYTTSNLSEVYEIRAFELL